MIQRRMIKHMVRRQTQNILDMGHDLGCFPVVQGEHAVENCDFVVSEGFFAFTVELEECLEFGLFEAVRAMVS
jgi:hypothetical protein